MKPPVFSAKAIAVPAFPKVLFRRHYHLCPSPTPPLASLASSGHEVNLPEAIVGAPYREGDPMAALPSGHYTLISGRAAEQWLERVEVCPMNGIRGVAGGPTRKTRPDGPGTVNRARLWLDTRLHVPGTTTDNRDQVPTEGASSSTGARHRIRQHRIRHRRGLAKRKD